MAERISAQMLQRMAQTKVNRRGFLRRRPTGSARRAAPSSAACSGASRPAAKRGRRAARPPRASRSRATSKKSSSCTTGRTTSTPDSMDDLQEHASASRSSRTTRSRATRRCSPSWPPAARPLRLRRPDGGVHADDGRAGLHPEARLVEDPEPKYINAEVQGPLVGPDTTSTSCPKDWGTTGILLRRKFVTEQVTTWKRVLRVSGRSTPARSSSSTRWATCSRPAQDARLLAELDRCQRELEEAARAPARASRRMSSP